MRQELHSIQVEKQVLYEQTRQAAVEAQDQIASCEKTIRQLRVEREDLEAYKIRLNREIDSLNIRLSTSEEESCQARARYNQLTSDMEAARAKVDQRQAEWDSIKEMLTNELDTVRNRWDLRSNPS